VSRAEPEKQRLLREAVASDAEAYRQLLAGEPERGREPLERAAGLYRRSWEEAGPRSFGRLIGMLKAAVLAGGGEPEARYVREQLGGEADSPASRYALALAALVDGDDELARRTAAELREDGAPFADTAEAIDAVAAGDEARYRHAAAAIVAEFEARDAHLTGVAIADTALVLARLAARRGIPTEVDSPLLPLDLDLD
jgi:hypothetical protein